MGRRCLESIYATTDQTELVPATGLSRRGTLTCISGIKWRSSKAARTTSEKASSSESAVALPPVVVKVSAKVAVALVAVGGTDMLLSMLEMSTSRKVGESSRLRLSPYILIIFWQFG